MRRSLSDRGCWRSRAPQHARDRDRRHSSDRARSGPRAGSGNLRFVGPQPYPADRRSRSMHRSTSVPECDRARTVHPELSEARAQPPGRRFAPGLWPRLAGFEARDCAAAGPEPGQPPGRVAGQRRGSRPGGPFRPDRGGRRRSRPAPPNDRCAWPSRRRSGARLQSDPARPSGPRAQLPPSPFPAKVSMARC